MPTSSSSSDAPNPRPDEDDRPVWRPFVDGLRTFIAGRVPEADAEDVLQDTLVRLHEAADSLRDADRAESWVFSIARRAIADHYRDEERRPVDGPSGAADDVADDPSPTLDNLANYDGAHDVHEEVLSWLRPMAEALPEMYRRPLVMADFEGHKQKEVADELGLSLSGAKSRVQRARTKLRERLQACCEVEFGPEGRAVAFRRRDERPDGDTS
jgi:RNA polymerase sigma-70 factor (ECF subfamily)